MADCIKTEIFLAEWKRACIENEGKCWSCQLKHFCIGAFNHNITPKEYMHPVIIGEVQQWSDEHPVPKPKTYAQDFFEKFPNAPKEDGIPMCCRASVYGDGSCDERYTGLGYENECIPCWNEPYEGSE